MALPAEVDLDRGAKPRLLHRDRHEAYRLADLRFAVAPDLVERRARCLASLALKSSPSVSQVGIDAVCHGLLRHRSAGPLAFGQHHGLQFRAALEAPSLGLRSHHVH